jgi:hypothetical protein
LEIGDWRLEIGDWNLEIRNWRLEIGDWSLEIEDCSIALLLPVNGQAIINSEFGIHNSNITLFLCSLPAHEWAGYYQF